MSRKETLLQVIPKQGILPLYYNADTEVSIQILKALYQAGIRTVEYTNRGEQALKNFREMRKVCDAELKDMYLGIGTIKNGEMAKAFIDAGADYLICPGLIETVATTADAAGMLWVPGCMTPTEIIKAESLGAKMIKLFPGNLLGPSFVSTIKELFPGISFMPTGGVEVNKENLSGWFKSGVVAVGMGSKLVSKEIMQNKEYDKLIALTKEAIEIINSVRK
jgi:2-dehydro-3-deoxyphosphogluconate aldolase / (4S)-4-hydroxy-2-oxoglutarate aldolase